MAADPSKLSYFSLPGEIRNKIMDLVLVHGDIYPCRPVSEVDAHTPDSAANVKSQPGIQLIATCKQACHEGGVLFYSSNIFHLPPTMTFEWSNRLQAKHKAMIKRISITFGLDELTPAMIDDIDRSLLMIHGNDRSLSSWVPDENSYFLNDAVFDTLGNSWRAKLNHIAAWTSLEEIEVRSFDHAKTLQFHDVVSNIYAFSENWNWSWWARKPYWDDMLEWPRKGVSVNIKAQVKKIGWKETIEWLRVRKPGEMAVRRLPSRYFPYP